MLRHEYADHVAALVAASMSGAAVAAEREVDIGQLARDAAEIAEALAAVRYPEAREVAPADTCECATCGGDMFLGDDSEGHAKPCPECVRAGRVKADA